MENHEFWQCIREIAQADGSVNPPNNTIDAALAIFQPSEKSQRFFRLQPSFAGMVRRSSPLKRVFELDDTHFVHVEENHQPNGIRLFGFASGVDETEVVLFGEESEFHASIQDGEFEFKSLPEGCYDMAFYCEGESLWIPKLVVGETKETE